MKCCPFIVVILMLGIVSCSNNQTPENEVKLSTDIEVLDTLPPLFDEPTLAKDLPVFFEYTGKIIQYCNEIIEPLDRFYKLFRDFLLSQEQYANGEISSLTYENNAIDGSPTQSIHVSQLLTVPSVFAMDESKYMATTANSLAKNYSRLRDLNIDLENYIKENDYRADEFKKGDNLIAQIKNMTLILLENRKSLVDTVFNAQFERQKDLVLALPDGNYQWLMNVDRRNVELLINDIRKLNIGSELGDLIQNYKEMAEIAAPQFKEIPEDFTSDYRREKYISFYLMLSRDIFPRLNQIINGFQGQEQEFLTNNLNHEMEELYRSYNVLVDIYNEYQIPGDESK